MATLRCTVSQCMHNKQNQCCNQSIGVGGGINASAADNTMCKDFVNGMGAMSSSSEVPNPNLQITCNAENCKHNLAGKCKADYVDISAMSVVSNSCDTQCSSFESK